MAAVQTTDSTDGPDEWDLGSGATGPITFDGTGVGDNEPATPGKSVETTDGNPLGSEMLKRVANSQGWM